MQIDEPAPPSEVSSYPVPQPEDPYIADLLQVADNRCVTYSFAELEGVDVCVSQGPQFNHCHCSIFVSVLSASLQIMMETSY